jgi:anti-sigma factor RsiW
MFNCKDSINLLVDFLDGTMEPEQEQQLIEHLEACPPCVDFVKTYRATPHLCKRALARRMPPELSEKLREFLKLKITK